MVVHAWQAKRGWCAAAAHAASAHCPGHVICSSVYSHAAARCAIHLYPIRSVKLAATPRPLLTHPCTPLPLPVATARHIPPPHRHSFQYTSFKDPKADNGKASMAILAYICKNIPIKAVTCTYGVDIGALGGATTDSPFGGVLEMANIADMRAYWKWLLADKEFAAFNKQYGPKASRIQYTTVAPAAAALALPGKPMPKVAAKVPAKMAAEPKMPAGRRLA